MLLSKKCLVKWNIANKKHYKSKNYKFTKFGDQFEINIKDITNGCTSIVVYECDYCKQQYKIQYNDYYKKRTKSKIQKDCCNNKECKHAKSKEVSLTLYGVTHYSKTSECKNKIKQTNLAKYGVEHPLQNEHIKNKVKQTNVNKYGVDNYSKTSQYRDQVIRTNIKRYGVDNYSKTNECKNKIKRTNLQRYGVTHYSKTSECKNKIKQTNLERYGVENPLQNEHIKNKVKQTNLERYGVKCVLQLQEIRKKAQNNNMKQYGVKYPLQSHIVHAKIKQTNLKKYGVKYPLQSSIIQNTIKQNNINKYGVDNPMKLTEIQNKVYNTLYINKTGISSYQQRYICKLLNGELNYPINNYKLDIAFPNKMLYIEYDGGGHDLSVKLGYITQKDFYIKEMKRQYYLKTLGWKLIRIVCSTDKLLDDNVLISLVNMSQTLLKNHSWVTIDVNNYILYNNSLKYTFNKDTGEVRSYRMDKIQDIFIDFDSSGTITNNNPSMNNDTVNNDDLDSLVDNLNGGDNGVTFNIEDNYPDDMPPIPEMNEEVQIEDGIYDEELQMLEDPIPEVNNFEVDNIEIHDTIDQSTVNTDTTEYNEDNYNEEIEGENQDGENDI